MELDKVIERSLHKRPTLIGPVDLDYIGIVDFIGAQLKLDETVYKCI